MQTKTDLHESVGLSDDLHRHTSIHIMILMFIFSCYLSIGLGLYNIPFIS